MHTLTCQGVQKSREHSYQGLSFSSPHFSDLTLVQHHSSYKLYIKRSETKYSLGGFPHHCKCLLLRGNGTSTPSVSFTKLNQYHLKPILLCFLNAFVFLLKHSNIASPTKGHVHEISTWIAIMKAAS
jgi:hypothetical protein